MWSGCTKGGPIHAVEYELSFHLATVVGRTWRYYWLETTNLLPISGEMLMCSTRISSAALIFLAATLCTNSVMAAQLLDYSADAPGIVTLGGLVTSLPDAAHALVATPVAGYSGPELTTTTINGVTRPALRFDGTASLLESSGSINVPPVGSLALVMNLTGPNPDPYVNRPVGWEDPTQGATGFSILATTPTVQPKPGLLVIARGVGIGDVSLLPNLGADYEIVVATWGAGGTTLSRTSTANVTAQAVNPAPGTVLPSAGVSTLHFGGSGLRPAGLIFGRAISYRFEPMKISFQPPKLLH